VAIIGSPTLTARGLVPCHWRTGGPIELAGDIQAGCRTRVFPSNGENWGALVEQTTRVYLSNRLPGVSGAVSDRRCAHGSAGCPVPRRASPLEARSSGQDSRDRRAIRNAAILPTRLGVPWTGLRLSPMPLPAHQPRVGRRAAQVPGHVFWGTVALTHATRAADPGGSVPTVCGPRPDLDVRLWASRPSSATTRRRDLGVSEERSA